MSAKIGERLLTAAQVAGVLATAWFVWVTAVLPRLGLDSLGATIAEALLCVTLAWICGGAITFCIYFVVSLADLPQVTQSSLRSSAPAMWFAPAIVLMTTPFALAFAVSLFLVANATRRLVAQWASVESPIDFIEPPSPEPEFLFRTAGPDITLLSWSFAPVLMGSATAQAGLVALLWRHPFLAAAFLALSMAILTSHSIATGAYRPGDPPALPHSALSVVWTFVLAVALTFGGISVHGRGGTGPDLFGSPSAGGQSATARARRVEAPPAESTGLGGDFPGVILLPELKPNTTIFVPSLAPPGKLRAPFAEPLGIPFSGEYWMFRWPARRPPQQSVIRRGSASELSFHTTDGWPMAMEAHQKLDTPVDVKCCRQMQVAIHNTDPYPGTVWLELILIDTAAPGPAVSLGTQDVGSDSRSDRTLSFRIPRVTAIRKFDEIKVVFHRDLQRADRSARIAIERFVLVP